MYNNFFRLFTSFFLVVIFLIFICFSFIYQNSENINFNIVNNNYSFKLSEKSNFVWPTPGYTTITSYFGYRNAPTAGASTYHSGIDIAAPVRYKYYFFI